MSIAEQFYDLYYIYFCWYYSFDAHCVMKKTSLFDTIFYFLMQFRSTSRISKGRNIAVILTEKRGGGHFLNLNLVYFIFFPERNKLASS